MKVAIVALANLDAIIAADLLALKDGGAFLAAEQQIFRPIGSRALGAAFRAGAALGGWKNPIIPAAMAGAPPPAAFAASNLLR